MISKTTDEVALTVRWVGLKELEELRVMLARAMNTLEPVHTPQWMSILEKECEEAIRQSRRPTRPVRKEYVTLPVGYAREAAQAMRDLNTVPGSYAEHAAKYIDAAVTDASKLGQ